MGGFSQATEISGVHRKKTLCAARSVSQPEICRQDLSPLDPTFHSAAPLQELA
jgi:hypothetical protein